MRFQKPATPPSWGYADLPVVWNHRDLCERQLLRAVVALRAMGPEAKVLIFCKMGEKRSLAVLCCLAFEVMGLHFSAAHAMVSVLREPANLEGEDKTKVEQACRRLPGMLQAACQQSRLGL